MNHAVIVPAYCRSCGSPCNQGDRYCSQCGGALVAVPNQGTPTPSLSPMAGPSLTASPAISRVLSNRFAVVAILACAGPIGLPLLWFSPRFSTPTKLVTSLLFVGLTVVFPIAVTVYWMEVAMRPLVDTFEQVNR